MVWARRDGGRQRTEGFNGSHRANHANGQFPHECEKCGAVRTDRQLGTEGSPELYVAALVEVFREVWRVLRDDGVAWLNLGDSYSSGGRKDRDPSLVSRSSGLTNRAAGLDRTTPEWAKPKDLLGIPWRVAFALQADGWYLRSDIIWNKPATMPESVKDRPTRSHEYIFLLAKSERYFYDYQAILEPASLATHARIAQPNILSQLGGAKDYDGNRSARRTLTNFAKGLIGSPGPNSRIHRSRDPHHPGELNGKQRGSTPKASLGTQGIEKQNESFQAATADLVLERNKRDVWTVAAEPNFWAVCESCLFAGEHFPTLRDDEGKVRQYCPRCGDREVSGHFATFPRELIRPCILAGSRVGSVVLDPFVGSGTTLEVCAETGRRGVGIELKPGYLAIARRRTAQHSLFGRNDDAAV